MGWKWAKRDILLLEKEHLYSLISLSHYLSLPLKQISQLFLKIIE